MSESVNPYAAPTANVEDVQESPEKDAIRREHIGHEASLKAVGFLYYLGGALVTAVAIGSLINAEPVAGILLLIFGAAQLVAGWGVRALRRWGRILGCVVSGIGVIGFPIGTLINGYILWLFLSKKGRTVFAPEYREVIAATPDVKYRTAIAVWIVVALLLGLALLGAMAAFSIR